MSAIAVLDGDPVLSRDPICIALWLNPSKRGFTLEGKNLLLLVQTLFFRVAPH